MANPLRKQLYLGAADRISDPARWTRGLKGVLWPSYKACAMGALYLVGKRLGLTRQQVSSIVGPDRQRTIITINDRHGRLPVIKYLRDQAATL